MQLLFLLRKLEADRWAKMADLYKARVKEFDTHLANEQLQLQTVRELCFRGIPEGNGRRAYAWRLLLNYLPCDRKLRADYLHKQRNLYQQFLNEMILISHSDTKVEDHPLNPNPDSQWQAFFKDNEVLLQIDKDVRRLCPDISFFSQPTTSPCDKVVDGKFDRLHQRVHQTRLNSQNVTRKGLGPSTLNQTQQKSSSGDYKPLETGAEAHWEVVERILFLYAKLNPGQGYVQGMNEIIGPIYYVFATDSRPEWREHAEADCFFCFTNLMSDIRDFFIKTLDDAESGISGIMKRFMGELKVVDPAAHSRLEAQDIKPQYFSFRWLTLMLSQEFPLPDVIRIWDSLLSDESRRDFLLHVCTAMIVLVRQDILTNEFPDNMKLLQNYPPMDVQVILSKAAELARTARKH